MLSGTTYLGLLLIAALLSIVCLGADCQFFLPLNYVCGCDVNRAKVGILVEVLEDSLVEEGSPVVDSRLAERHMAVVGSIGSQP